jgi:hypothetical protein
MCLGVDESLGAGIVARADFERASGIVAEEALVRLGLHDYPPAPGSQGQAGDAEPGTAPDLTGR